MPYRHAHWFVLALLPITVLAFWPTYFAVMPSASVSHHVHGLTGTAWILLIAAQSWSIHNERRQLHKTVGKSVFILGPLMIAGFAMATYAGAVKSIANHPFYEMFGHALLTADVWLLFVTPILLYLAFRHRRKVRVHGALMFATLIGLVPPILARLFGMVVPGLTIRGPETLYRFEYNLAASMVVTVVIALWLYFRSQRDGWPWLLAAGITAISYVLYLSLGQLAMWNPVVTFIAGLPIYVVALSGFVLGLAACLAGWFAAPSPKAPMTPSVQTI